MVVCACFCQKCKLCLILAGILVIFVIAGVALREFIVKINVKFEGLLSFFLALHYTWSNYFYEK